MEVCSPQTRHTQLQKNEHVVLDSLVSSKDISLEILYNIMLNMRNVSLYKTFWHIIDTTVMLRL